MKRKTIYIVASVILALVGALALCLCILAQELQMRKESSDTSAQLNSIPESKFLATRDDTAAHALAEQMEVEKLVWESEMAKLYDVPMDAGLQFRIIGLCEERGIDPAIVMAMIWRESRYRADAIGDGGNSFGLMQIQPKWHSKRMERLGCTDLLDPHQNVTVGIDYLAYKLDSYDGDIEKALVGYNQGSYKGTITAYAKTILAKAEEIGGAR